MGCMGTRAEVSAATVESGFDSDYNIYYRGSGGAAQVALWGSQVAADLAALKTLAGGNTHSLQVNPGFIDVDGADNILGGLDTALGGGNMRVSRIASGVPHGGDLEFADQITLGRAIDGRRAMRS